MTAWPNPDKPGYPLNPERDGDHVLCISQATGATMAFRWVSGGSDTTGFWRNMVRNEYVGACPNDAVRLGFTYVSPVYTTADLAAARAEGAAAGYDAGFAASGEGWNGEHPGNAMSDDSYQQRKASDLLALPIPAADALARRDGGVLTLEQVKNALDQAGLVDPAWVDADKAARIVLDAIRARAVGGDAPCMRCDGGECQRCEGNPT